MVSTWFERSGVLAEVRKFVASRSREAFLVGGFLRDRLLGRDPQDLDLAVPEGAIPLARELGDLLGGSFFPLDQARDVGRVLLGGVDREFRLDVASLEGRTVEEDLSRRDFTVNALAIDLQAPLNGADVLDPHGGLQDLEDRVLRAVSKGAFREDPLRLLRGIRLAGELGLRPEPQTEAWMRRDAALVGRVAGERVRDELVRILSFERAHFYVGQLPRLGMASAIFPGFPPWPLGNHAVRTVEALEQLLAKEASEDSGPGVATAWPRVDRHLGRRISGGRSRLTLLKIVALLHHLPPTSSAHPPDMQPSGQGLEAALRRLRLSTREVRRGTRILRALSEAWRLTGGEDPGHVEMHRFYREAGGAGVEAVILSLADWMGARDAGRVEGGLWGVRLNRAGYLLAAWFEDRHRILPQPLLDGEDLLRRLPGVSGPAIGRLLSDTWEAQVEGQVEDREGALVLAERLWGEMRPRQEGE
ncbi:MAG: hypothetical protein ACE5NC_00195 [Anaerolineae bacterium]